MVRICREARKGDTGKMQAAIAKDASKQKQKTEVSEHASKPTRDAAPVEGASKKKRKARVRTESVPAEPVRAEQFDVTHQIPNGSVVQVQCGINTAENRVVSAQVLPGAVLTDLDVETMLSSGYCIH